MRGVARHGNLEDKLLGELLGVLMNCKQSSWLIAIFMATLQAFGGLTEMVGSVLLRLHCRVAA